MKTTHTPEILRFLFIVTMLTNASVVSAAPMTADELRPQLLESHYQGCMSRQSRDSANQMLRSDFIEQVCRCVAERTTTAILSSPAVLSALKRDSFEEFKRAATPAYDPDSLRRTQLSCMNGIDGALAAIDPSKSPPSSMSRTKGLTGQDRRDAVWSATTECMTGSPGRLTQSQFRTYCECSANYLADNLSQYDLAMLALSTRSGSTIPPAIQRTIDAGAQLCHSRAVR